VDIEPGVTLVHIFELADRNEDIKHFLADYCSCDIDALHKKCREGGETILLDGLERMPDGGIREVGKAPADILLVSPMFWAYTDQTGDRRLDGGYMLLVRSSRYPDCASTLLREDYEKYFGHLCKLELRLDTLVAVAECDEDKIPEGQGDLVILEAHIRCTLMDVLTTIYEFFGEPVFDLRDQRQVDQDEGFYE
jgi:hypothetical protein